MRTASFCCKVKGTCSDKKTRRNKQPPPFMESIYRHELRLHHLIMTSTYRLGFKNPTPIQKACIPAVAHQGKDVVSAAGTGSGKTLAFGLRILQRLLNEKEKAVRTFDEKGEEAEKFAPNSLLRQKHTWRPSKFEEKPTCEPKILK